VGFKTNLVKGALNLTRTLVTKGPSAAVGTAVRSLHTRAHEHGLLPQGRLASKIASKLNMAPRQSLLSQGRPTAYSTVAEPMGPPDVLPPQTMSATPATLPPGLSSQTTHPSPMSVLNGFLARFESGPVQAQDPLQQPPHAVPPQPAPVMAPFGNPPPLFSNPWDGAALTPEPPRRQTQGAVPYDPAPLQTRPPQLAARYTQEPEPMSPSSGGRLAAPRRGSAPLPRREAGPSWQETPALPGRLMPQHAEARAPGKPPSTASDTMRQAGLTNAVAGGPQEDLPYGAPTRRSRPPPPVRRHTLPAMPEVRTSATALPDFNQNEYAFWDGKAAASSARPRRQSDGGLRMRTNPATGLREVWKPEEVDLNDGFFDEAWTNAQVLRDRVFKDHGIVRPPGEKLDPSKNQLDARCLEAALQGSSAVSLKDIDMDGYR